MTLEPWMSRCYQSSVLHRTSELQAQEGTFGIQPTDAAGAHHFGVSQWEQSARASLSKVLGILMVGD